MMRKARFWSKSLLASLGVAGLMAGIWGAAALTLPCAPPVLISAGLYGALCLLNWFDFDHFRIPNWISYPLIGFGLLSALVPPGLDFVSHFAGAIVGYGLIWGINAYWRRYRGQEGIGMGDAKLLSAAGAWLGVLALPFVTLIASGCALLWIVLKSIFTKTNINAAQRIPFGPFISLGFWLVWQVSGAF